MVPFRSSKTNRQYRIVTIVTICLLAVIYILDTLSSLRHGGGLGILSLLGIKSNNLIIQGEYWRLLTPNLLHSGLSHIAMNCFGLYIWGRYIEFFYGGIRYIFILLVSALMCVAFSFAFNSSLALGASGMVFGLYGALLGVRKFNKEFFNAVFGVQLLVFIGFSVVTGFMKTYTDNFGHIGGLIGGYLASRVVCLRQEHKPTLQRCLAAVFLMLIYGTCLAIGFMGLLNR